MFLCIDVVVQMQQFELLFLQLCKNGFWISQWQHEYVSFRGNNLSRAGGVDSKGTWQLLFDCRNCFVWFLHVCSTYSILFLSCVCYHVAWIGRKQHEYGSCSGSNLSRPGGVDSTGTWQLFFDCRKCFVWFLHVWLDIFDIVFVLCMPTSFRMQSLRDGRQIQRH